MGLFPWGILEATQWVEGKGWGRGGEHTRMGCEREGVLGQGLLLTECSWTEFQVSFLCCRLATPGIRKIRREMFMKVFLWRGEGVTQHLNNLLGFLFLSFEFRSSDKLPLFHWVWSCHGFGVFYTLLSPRSWFGDLWSKTRLSLWVPLLSLRKGCRDRGKTKWDANTEGERGVFCDTQSFSCMGSPPALQDCKNWDGGSSWVIPCPPIPILAHTAASVRSHSTVVGGIYPMVTPVETGLELVLLWWLYN